MMHSSNGNTDRYSGLPMDYGMHHPHHPGAPPQQHPHHPEHAHLAAHYALPPSHHPGGPIPHHAGLKRSPESAGLEMMSPSGGASSDDDEGSMHDVKPVMGERGVAGRGSSKGGGEGPPAGKKTKGRVKIKMEFIDNKLRRYTTFSKRKTGIMKKAYELSTLTGTQVMLLVASETGHVYTFATRKLQPMITSDAGKALIQTCLNSPDPPNAPNQPNADQRMSASGYEETELTYNAIADAAAAAAAADAAEQQKVGGEELVDSEEEEEEEIEVQNQPSEEEEEEQDDPKAGPSSSSSRPRLNSSLPPEVISQLLATGHIVRDDGTLIRLPPGFTSMPSTSSSRFRKVESPEPPTLTITAKDLSKKSNQFPPTSKC